MPESVTLDLTVAKLHPSWRFVDTKQAESVWYTTLRAGRDVPEPRVLSAAQAAYPSLAREARVEGTVVVDCWISAEGKATRFRVLRGIPFMNEAAIDAIKRSDFEPTIVDGKPVPVVFAITMQFKLD